MRTGFTTGAAATAAARAALILLVEGRAPQRVRVDLPGGQSLSIPVESCAREGAGAMATVIKDAGDDPDITHGACIGARVDIRDGAGLEIAGGQGVGRVTKPGLEIPPGEPAINPAPRDMLRRAVGQVLEAHGVMGRVRVEVFVRDGEILARKTLNARLGIVGGLSILGTTGLVKPLSHEAYTAAIASALSVARACGSGRVVLTTGRRSEKHAQTLFSGLAPEAFVQMGDFFEMAVSHAAKMGIPSIMLAVFFGKALKMARGMACTHAAKGSLTMEMLAQWTLEVTRDPALAREVAGANTARHAFGLLYGIHDEVISRVGRGMMETARLFAGDGPSLRALILDFDGNPAFDSNAGEGGIP